MIRIIDDRSTGKSGRLILLAKENNAIIACSNPHAMKEKAHNYGIIGVEFISYYDYSERKYDLRKKVYIDELEMYVRYLDDNVCGYTLSVE